MKADEIDTGITVTAAARILATVRRMVENGDLEGWRVGVGRRSIRVSLPSCLDYRETNSAAAPVRARAPEAPAPRRPVPIVLP